MKRMGQERAGFTLVELLVVIGNHWNLGALLLRRCRRPRGRAANAVHEQSETAGTGTAQLSRRQQEAPAQNREATSSAVNYSPAAS